MKIVAVLSLLVCVAFAAKCSSQTYSNDDTIKVGLIDYTSEYCTAEVTQRFDLSTFSAEDVTVDVSCLNFYLTGFTYNLCVKGSIVIRALDSESNNPGDILHEIDADTVGFCPFKPDVYTFDKSFSFVIPKEYKKTIFIGYRSPANPSAHTSVFAADKDVSPVTPSFLWINTTGKWEYLSLFYGHLGINADLTVH